MKYRIVSNGSVWRIEYKSWWPFWTGQHAYDSGGYLRYITWPTADAAKAELKRLIADDEVRRAKWTVMETPQGSEHETPGDENG